VDGPARCARPAGRAPGRTSTRAGPGRAWRTGSRAGAGRACTRSGSTGRGRPARRLTDADDADPADDLTCPVANSAPATRDASG
jgi:hypothetical protein